MNRGLALRCVFTAVITLAVANADVLAAQDDPAKKADAVTVVIDYGDGMEKHFTKVPWTKGTTVLAALRATQEHPRGIKTEFRGEGATAFVTKIDDLENQGAERNWMYRVNGKVAKVGCGAYELSAGDVVLWRFQ